MVDRRWSAGETAVLIEAWRPLYNRRRGGESDVWVPASQRGRARSTRALVPEDWRAVATAVNSFRSEINLDPIRTHKQCKMRVELLKSQFGEEQFATPSWFRFLSLYNNTVGARGPSSLRVPATAGVEAHGGDECGGGPAGGQARGGSAVGERGSAAAEVNGGFVMGVPVGADTENASDGVAVEVEVEWHSAEDGGTTTPEEALGNGATSEDPPTGPVDRAATDFLVAPIPKKRRTDASTTTSAGGGDGQAPSVKGELVREANARRAPAAAVAAEMAATLGEVVAAHSNDVTVVENLVTETTKLYREVTKQRIELQRQMVAALAATMGGAAEPEPDAAPYMRVVGV